MGFLRTAGAFLFVDVAVATRKRSPLTTPLVVEKTIAGVPVLNYEKAYSGSVGVQDSTADNQEEDWIVMLDDSASDDQIQALCDMTQRGCDVSGHPDDDGIPFLKMRGTEVELAAVIEAADEGAPAKFIEVDVEVSLIPDVPEEESGDVTIAAATWGLNKIEHDSRSTSGKGVKVYILDTGIRTTHTDFGGRALKYADASSGSVKTCSASSSTCARDVQGHGTHCASTATGSKYGVANRARVYAAKVLGDSGSGSTSGIAGTMDLISGSSSKPAVLSMSLGGPGQSGTLRSAVDKATGRGFVVVVAGGNENSNACNYSPAFVASAITVGSSTSTDTRSGFSNYGSCVNIWAPGSSIEAASVSSDTRTTRKSGTSMACPHVAGGAALVLEAGPSKSPSRVRSDLTSNAFSGKLSGLKSGDTNRLLRVRGLR